MYSENLVEDDSRIAAIVTSAKRVAVLGASAEPGSAAYFVPEYLQRQGVEIVPVPVGTDAPAEILGVATRPDLAGAPGPLDVVDVFLRPRDVEAHLPALLAARPRCVWMQIGIHSAKAAEALARAGILVVQDRCLMAEHRRAVRRR